MLRNRKQIGYPKVGGLSHIFECLDNMVNYE